MMAFDRKAYRESKKEHIREYMKEYRKRDEHKKYMKEYYERTKEQRAAKGKLERAAAREMKYGTKEQQRAAVMERRRRARLLGGARDRARKNGREFDLTLDDIVIPSHCPVLGLPLDKEPGKENGGSPSLDRVDNTKGYVKGNVRVISRRANWLKRDATIEEIEKLLAYMKGDI